VLAWPGSLGGEVHRQVDDPIAMAARMKARDIELEGSGCVMEIGGWRIRVALSEAGAEVGTKLLKKMGDSPTMLLQHAGVPEGVDHIKLLRETLPGQRFMVTVKFSYPITVVARKVASGAGS
jgi:hypothetical protein